MKMLEEIQTRAMRIISGALPSTPIASLHHYLDLPTISALRLARGFFLLANLHDGQISEFVDFYKAFSSDEAEYDRWWNESPFAAAVYAEQTTSARFGPVLEGRTRVGHELSHLFRAAFQTSNLFF